MSSFWSDQKRSPGPLPQGNRLALALRVVAAVIAVLLIDQIHNHVVIGAFVLLIGLSGFYTVARLNQGRLNAMRYTRGPGWMIGLLVSKTSLPVARAIWLAMSLGICALGILSIVLLGHHH
jgi:hypothetical protein